MRHGVHRLQPTQGGRAPAPAALRDALARLAEAEAEQQRLRDILWAMDVGTWEWNVQTGETRFNARWAEIVGHTLDELSPCSIDTWMALAHPDDLAVSSAALQAHFEGLTDQYVCEVRMRHRDGHWVWVQDRGRVISHTPAGEPLWMAGTHQDISDRKRDELARAESERKYRLLFELLPVGVSLSDERGQIIETNAAAQRILGVSATAHTTRSIDDRAWHIVGLDGQELPPERFASVRALATGEPVHGQVMGVFQPTGQLRWIEVSAAPLALPGYGVLVVYRDITDAHDHALQLEHAAQHDVLTTLPNRLLLTDRLQQAVTRVRHQGGSLAVVYLDLDRFGPAVEHHGRAATDAGLRQLARRLEDTLAPTDTLARIGDDELVAVIVAPTRKAPWGQILDGLLSTVRRTVADVPVLAGVTASLGVSLLDPTGATGDDHLIRDAAQAMFRAKQAGGDGYRLFDQQQDQRVQRMGRVAAELRRALAQGELRLHYQPQIDLRRGAVIGVEALIRWQHPERGLLGPDQFLRQVRDAELARALGGWVLAEATRQAAGWRREGLRLAISVNVDPRQLEDPAFPDRLAERLAQYPELQPADLTLEILETAAVERVALLRAVIERCRALGVRFALDDFGTGYASLTHLKHLPVDQVKVDRRFVQSQLADPEDRAILEAVIALADAFGREVVAEGVEALALLPVLTELGCDLAQGFAIARPMAPEHIQTWCAAWQGSPGGAPTA